MGGVNPPPIFYEAIMEDVGVRCILCGEIVPEEDPPKKIFVEYDICAKCDSTVFVPRSPDAHLGAVERERRLMH